jgi:hypothetical protein
LLGRKCIALGFNINYLRHLKEKQPINPKRNVRKNEKNKSRSQCINRAKSTFRKRGS